MYVCMHLCPLIPQELLHSQQNQMHRYNRHGDDCSLAGGKCLEIRFLKSQHYSPFHESIFCELPNCRKGRLLNFNLACIRHCPSQKVFYKMFRKKWLKPRKVQSSWARMRRNFDFLKLRWGKIYHQLVSLRFYLIMIYYSWQPRIDHYSNSSIK